MGNKLNLPMAMADSSQEPSSSGPTSGSSQSVPSSMDSAATVSTLQTQDVVDGLGSDEEFEPKYWGRLFPLNPHFDMTGERIATQIIYTSSAAYSQNDMD